MIGAAGIMAANTLAACLWPMVTAQYVAAKQIVGHSHLKGHGVMKMVCERTIDMSIVFIPYVDRRTNEIRRQGPFRFHHAVL